MGVSWVVVSLYFSRRPDWYLTLSPLVAFYLKFGDIGDHTRAPFELFFCSTEQILPRNSL